MIKNPSATNALHGNWTESPLSMSRELNPLHVGDERPTGNSAKLRHDMPVLGKVIHSTDTSITQELPYHPGRAVSSTAEDHSHSVSNEHSNVRDGCCGSAAPEVLLEIDQTKASGADYEKSHHIHEQHKSESQHSDTAKIDDNNGIEEHKEIAIHDAAPEQELAQSSMTADMPKNLTATQPKQVAPVQKKETKHHKVETNNIFGRMVEQEYGSFAVKASDYSIDEQTRFAKMTVGGILAKKPEEKVDPVVPEFAKIYLSQPIEKEGATNNWDSFATADKTVTPPSFESAAIAPALDSKKAPNTLSRLIFGERRGSTNDTSDSPPVETADSEVFPDEDETVLADPTNPDGKVVRKKSIIMGAMDLIRGKKKDSTLTHEISKVDESESLDVESSGVRL